MNTGRGDFYVHKKNVMTMMLKKGKYESWVYEALPSVMYMYSAVVHVIFTSVLPYILVYNVTVLIGLL
jgi:hypothetical protein